MRKPLTLLIILTGFGCSYESVQDLTGMKPCGEVSFADDIKPLIQQNCALSGCHLGVAGRPDFSMDSEIFDHAELIRFRTSGRTMPPSGIGITLTDEEIDAIACWVDAGTPDN